MSTSAQATGTRHFPFHSRPLKGLYTTYTVLVALAKLPWWIICYAIPWWRPRRSWSLKKLLTARVLREFWSMTGQIGTPPPALIRDKAKFERRGAVWIPAAPDSFIRGEVKEKAELNNVQAVDVPGYWFGGSPTVKPVESNERVLINFHGGGYVLGSAHHDDASSNIPKRIVQYAAKSGAIHRALSVEYRLCSGPPYHQYGQFPSGILDGLSAYLYVLKLGFKPENIFVAGDSAGGHLALGFIRYLVDAKLEEAPVPTGGLLLLSPWTDMTTSHDKPGFSALTNRNSDYLGAEGLTNYAVDALLYRISKAELESNPYFSSTCLTLDAKGLFSSEWPRTYIITGEAEILRDQDRTLKQRMEADGVEVMYWEVQDGIHDWLWFPWLEPEGSRTLHAITRWASKGVAAGNGADIGQYKAAL